VLIPDIWHAIETELECRLLTDLLYLAGQDIRAGDPDPTVGYLTKLGLAYSGHAGF
jgi:hypothetical protein